MSVTSSLYQKFSHGIWWNALEAIPYQLMLAAHNMVLFGVIGAHAYGLVGTLFSLIFLAVGVTGFGFESSLSTFFADAQASKADCKRIIGWHYAPTMLGLMVAVALVPRLMPVATPWPVVMIVAVLIFVEGLKKGMRALLHAAFYNRQTALIELFQVVTYVTLVWTGYGLGLQLDTQLLFGSLLSVSTACLIMLGYQLYLFYAGLPNQKNHKISLDLASRKSTLAAIVRQRCYTTVTMLSHQFFSGNALVPLFAYRFGLSSAGTLKIICTIAYGATVCIAKIFGSTSDALFAQIKHGKLHEKQQAFSLVTQHLYAALYGVVLFGALAIIWLYAFDLTTFHDAPAVCALLFFVIHISEQFFSTYERFFITENRAGELMLFNGATIGCLYAVLQYAPSNNPILMLQSVLCIRLISFALLSGVAFAWWRIRPQLKINPLYLACSLAFSLICFLMVR